MQACSVHGLEAFATHSLHCQVGCAMHKRAGLWRMQHTAGAGWQKGQGGSMCRLTDDVGLLHLQCIRRAGMQLMHMCSACRLCSTCDAVHAGTAICVMPRMQT